MTNPKPGMFDDLIPAKPPRGVGMFDDLIPKKASWRDAPLVEDQPAAPKKARWQDAPLVEDAVSAAPKEDEGGSFAGWLVDKATNAIPGKHLVSAAYQVAPEVVGGVGQWIKGQARAAASGATLGFSDRAEAAVTSALTDATYDDELARIRKAQDDHREDWPLTSIGAELVGGIAMPAGPALRGAKYVGDRVRTGLRASGYGHTAAKVGGGVAGSAAAGGGFGAVAGIGHTEDLTDKGGVVADAAIGGLTGAALGPALEYGGAGIWNLAKEGGKFARDAGGRVAEAFGGDATNAAVRKLADVSERRGKATLPGQSREDTRRSGSDFAKGLRESGGRNLAIADREVEALVAGLAARADMPDAPFSGFADRHLRGQTERVAGEVAETLAGRPVSARALADALDDNATTAFNPKYDAQRNERPVRVTGLRQLADDNVDLPQFLNEARKEAIGHGHLTRAEADTVFRDGKLLTNNLPTSMLEPLRRRLGEAATAGDRTASGLKRQLDAAIGKTKRGDGVLKLSSEHRQAFAEREGGEAGRSLWGTTGTTRDEAMRGFASMNPGQQDAFRDSAAAGVQSRMLADKGTFSKPRDFLDSAENRSAMDELFGSRAVDARRIIEREGRAYDVAGHLIGARQGSEGQKVADVIDHGLKTGVQWRFTRSAATLSLLERLKSQITKQRSAAIADLALSPSDEPARRVYAELLHREAVAARAPETRRQIGAYGQALANALGAYR
ncbi:hypothetical protein APY04_1866 [Hyphomicrobium sulfonivorans]|uniref:Uncharacterized protein n=1 Tax=Hyphomicrobium sulfonivorans TaxID=121290 RepID=A0A109BF05_HYPSL|nr:hypothetical protein [Hyphomicrobium sulfonivorans]KWT67507.1 hypothetical protein APY04_1866 [Hyphomicrobium sulfonivorans]